MTSFLKTRSVLFHAFFLTMLCLTVSGEAQTLTKKQINKFKGEYFGPVSGIAGNTTSGSAGVAFDTGVRFTGKTVEFLIPQISNLHASPNHRIAYRKPTGTENRIKITGYYTGTAINPTTSLAEPVSGIRKMVITDRGKGTNVRFVMRFTDTLREGGYSAQDIKGTLGKEK